mmetsp:Transcript_37192/g.104963  ORF Transcript_37192/g.104963 Transcript_37192/m.104963 type:complete len:483 (-) Transcript_37192:83-1531(-)
MEGRGRHKGKSSRHRDDAELSTGWGEPEEDRWFRGKIKYFDESKGYGFIRCPELVDEFKCDVFVHQSQLNGCAVRDEVEFLMKLSSKRQPQATELRRCDGHKEYTGVIKFIDREKGYAFVTCDELHEVYSTDVYVAQQELQDLAAEVRDIVRFAVKLGKKGGPQAVNLSLVRPPPSSNVDGDCDEEEGAEDIASGRLTGTVKSFDVDRGYGFISSPEVKKRYDRDVFLHSKQIKQFQMGDHVTFSLRINGQGNPQAYDLKEAVGSEVWLLSGMSENSQDKEVYVGEIKSFSTSHGYGFIDCPALHAQYGRDVFVHQSQLEGLHVGNAVTFQMQVKRGQPQAYHVSRDAAGRAPTPKTPKGPFAHLDAGDLSRKLHRACASARCESIDLMRELLDAGADPNSPDVTGSLPLMISALNDRNSERKCRLLIERLADVNARHNSSTTVLQWARERINAKFATYLKALHQGEDIAYSATVEPPPEEY